MAAVAAAAAATAATVLWLLIGQPV